MPRVALIVTGRLERDGLPSALKRLFPEVEFASEPVEGFTSSRVTVAPAHTNRPASILTNAEKMAQAMMLALDPGRREVPADYAFAIEDLELANDDQPDTVVNVFREAVRSRLPHLHGTAYRQNRCEEQVPLRCSFHLVRPMIEFYLYADPDALIRAGAQRLAILRSDSDLEDFETDDPDYRAIINSTPGTPQTRLRHPKWYLRWLCDPTCLREQAYKETKGGLAAVRELDWSRVLGQPDRCPFLRSLIVDLADALGRSLPFSDLGGNPLTSRHNPGRRNATLRNI
jgi:hypothetical protein